MDFSQFHFENNLWLSGIAVIPAVLLLYALFYKSGAYAQSLERFADKHLLPHLLKDGQRERRNWQMPLLLWSLAWLCGMVAMAGPRWNYTDVQAFKPEKDLVIVLDLSTSMEAQDVKPSRVVRGRQRIEDLLKMSRGMTVGFVAYAAVPHMITPLTDDTRTISNLLPAIDTSLVTLQGDRLKPALEMADRMLSAEPGSSKSILVISDGNFEENDMAALVKAAGGAAIYTMGVGTAEGAPIADEGGGWLKDRDGKMLVTRLRADRLQALSAAGHGFYVEENYSDSGIKSILNQINGPAAGQQDAHKNIRIWQERFYIPALALALLLLPLFRKRYVFPAVVFLMLLSASSAEAASWTDLFLNRDQQGLKAYDQGNYQKAMEKFNTPYQHGVAAYKAGRYDQAVQSFKAAQGVQAEYNLGNAQLMQGKAEEAIASYENVLKQNPNDAHAKHNLEIAKKMLQQQKEQPQNKESSDQKKDGQQDKQQSQNSQGGQNGQKQDAKNQPQKSSQNGQAQPQPGQEHPSPQQQQASDKQQGAEPQNGAQAQKQEAQKQEAQKQEAQQQQAQKQQADTSAQEQKDKAQAQPQGSAQSAEAQKKKEQQQQQQNSQEATAQEEGQQQPAPNGGRPRTQQDINADQWLDRIQNDPGSFLKNQFMIEDRDSGQQ